MINLLLNPLPHQNSDEKIMIHFSNIFHDIYYYLTKF